MDEISIEQARTDLRSLVERVAGGETILIVDDGKPMATLSPAHPSVAGAAPQRLGFLVGAFSVPEDFDRLGEREIAGLFGDAS